MHNMLRLAVETTIPICLTNGTLEEHQAPSLKNLKLYGITPFSGITLGHTPAVYFMMCILVVLFKIELCACFRSHILAGVE